MSMLERIIDIRQGGGTERCHGVRHMSSYSVGKHSWGVAVLMFVLWPEDFPRLASYCLFHDVPEPWVGDMPAPSKRYSPPIKYALTKLEGVVFQRLGLPDDQFLDKLDKQKLRACDLLELYLWAREEVCGGNQHADTVRREIERFVVNEPLLPEAKALFEEIKHGSVEYDQGRMFRVLYPGT